MNTLLTTAIIALIAGTAIENLNPKEIIDQATVTCTLAEDRQIEQAKELYTLDNFPSGPLSPLKCEARKQLIEYGYLR